MQEERSKDETKEIIFIGWSIGEITGKFNDGSTDYPANGKLGSDGKLSEEMNAAAYGVKIGFTETVDKSTGAVNGTWENSAINKKRTIFICFYFPLNLYGKATVFNKSKNYILNSFNFFRLFIKV